MTCIGRTISIPLPPRGRYPDEMQPQREIERPVPPEPASGRTSLVLSASQIEFLERLCARLRRDAGARFTKAVLIRELVAVLVASGAPPADVRTETHLKEWLRGNIAVEATASPSADGPRTVGGRA